MAQGADEPRFHLSTIAAELRGRSRMDHKWQRLALSKTRPNAQYVIAARNLELLGSTVPHAPNDMPIQDYLERSGTPQKTPCANDPDA
jgi:hypothetical protein